MARGTPQFSSGVIPGAGSGVIRALGGAIKDCLTSYISNGESAWQVIDTITDTSTSFDWVLQSVGDRSLGILGNKGDTEIFLRLWRSSGSIYTKMYQDWSPTSHSGARPSYNGGNGGLDDVSSVEWWGVVNEYSCCFVWVQGGFWRGIMWGQPIRPYSSPLNGIARLSVATSGTGTITLSVDRDISANLKVGQMVWLVNHTPTGQALKTPYTETVIVENVTSSTIQVSGVTNTPYEVGSLVGLDPCANMNAVAIDSNNNFYTCNDKNGTWGGEGGSYAGSNVSLPMNESEEDPEWDGLYGIVPMWISMASAPTGYRGNWDDTVRLVGIGTQANKDIMRIDFDDTKKYMVFPSIQMGLGYALCIGPGAS